MSRSDPCNLRAVTGTRQHMRTLSFSPKLAPGLSVNAIIERQRRRQRQRPRQRLGQTIIANSSCGTRELKTPLLHVGISRSRQVVLAFVAAISGRLRLGLLVRPARQRPSNSLQCRPPQNHHLIIPLPSAVRHPAPAICLSSAVLCSSAVVVLCPLPSAEHHGTTMSADVSV